MNNEEVKELVENEGLGYAVSCYTDGGEFEDEKLKRLWAKAKKALNDIENYLEINLL